MSSRVDRFALFQNLYRAGRDAVDMAVEPATLFNDFFRNRRRGHGAGAACGRNR